MATFTNQATLTYNGTTTASNIVTGEILEVLSAQKNAVVDAYTAGDDITYVISILNTGQAPLTGLTLTDDLGAYTFGAQTLTPLTYANGSIRYYVNGVLQPAPTVTAQAPLTVTGLNVPAGGNAMLLYEANTNQYAPRAAGARINNTATISGAGVTNPVTAAEAVTAAERAALTINKAVSPRVVTENGALTYTFTIQNSGNTAVTPADNATVSDRFNPILSNLAVSLNGTPLTAATDYTYDQATGEFTLTPGRITVPAATYTQDAATGAWTTEPGISTLTVTGTL